MLGAGSWGTALAIGLVEKGHAVTLWARRPEAAARMQQDRRNPMYLPAATLPPALHVTASLAEAIQDATLWVFATPSQSVRHVAEQLAPSATPNLIIVSVAKGIENGTLKTTSQVLTEVLPTVPSTQIGVLYGPSHAEEVGHGLPTTVVAAAPTEAVATAIQDVFMSPTLRVYTNLDLIGVEIAGSVKNVMAIAAGMSDGICGGDNAKAALVTRGIAEITRLGLAMGASPNTFAGLAGIGDLVVTCMSRHSRNRHLGEQLGQGRSLADIEAEMQMVAEGVRTTASVVQLAAQYGVEMPITQAVYEILFEGKTAQAALQELMTRSAKREDYTASFCPDPAVQ